MDSRPRSSSHVPELTATTRRTDGSWRTCAGSAGPRDVAFSLADTAADAHTGRGRFRKPVPIRALARLYDNYVQVIVRDDSGHPGAARPRRQARLARRPGVGHGGHRRARARGLRSRRRTIAAAPPPGHRAVRAGAGGGRDRRVLLERRAAHRGDHRPAGDGSIRLLELRGVAAKLRERYRHSDVYTQSRVPPGIYKLRAAVTTVSVPNLLVVREDLPEETAYRLTRLLFEHREELGTAHDEARKLNERGALATYPVPRTRGAALVRALGSGRPPAGRSWPRGPARPTSRRRLAAAALQQRARRRDAESRPGDGTVRRPAPEALADALDLDGLAVVAHAQLDAAVANLDADVSATLRARSCRHCREDVERVLHGVLRGVHPRLPGRADVERDARLLERGPSRPPGAPPSARRARSRRARRRSPRRGRARAGA